MKNDRLIFDAEIIECLGGIRFKLKLDNDHEVIATISGKLRKCFIRLVPADRVQVELCPYDLDKGRIVYRYNQR